MNKEILKISQKVHKIFKKKNLKLSVAESCTGGLISHYITTPPGASGFFEAGVVTYSIASKKKILKISPKTISLHGAVSKETAKEMAQKMRLLTRTDYTISTTGNLGPDILEGKAKGLVYIAVGSKKQALCKKLILKNSREKNKETASIEALKFLIEVVEKIR
ncbi:MAG: CinA family protein [Nitrospirae bacterium]|nr:CinA family protein [Nitrospirota bacterium]